MNGSRRILSFCVFAISLCQGAYAQNQGASVQNSPSQTSRFPHLERIASESLAHNIANVDGKHYLSAGSHQFMGLWTRDFAFASRGLPSIGRSDVIADHLELVLGYVRASDGLVPRYVDRFNTTRRYLDKFLGKYPAIRAPLKPEYKGGGGKGLSIDSNLLIALVAIQNETLLQRGREGRNDALEETLAKVLSYYGPFFKDGLIEQPEFADWQDSVNREGRTFYTNLIAWKLATMIEHNPERAMWLPSSESLRAEIEKAFFDPVSGLYFSVAGHPMISIDPILMAIDWGFITGDRAKAVYRALRAHPVYTRARIPGGPTYPFYPNRWVDAVPKGIGMKGYHQWIIWSWITGLSAKVAAQMGDIQESDRILFILQEIALRDGVISEVYQPYGRNNRWVNILYRSESPFSWGSGMILDALAYRRALDAQ